MNTKENTATQVAMNSALAGVLASKGLAVTGLTSTPLWITTEEIVEATIDCVKSQKGNPVFKCTINDQVHFVHAGVEYQSLIDGEYTPGTQYKAMLDIRVPAKLTLDEVKAAYKDNDIAIKRWEDASKDETSCRLVIDSVL